MPKLGGIYVSVRARTDKYKRDLKKAKTLTGKAAVLMQKQISSINFKQVGIAALAFGATVAFGMKKAIDAASNLEETVGKFDVVFADHAMQAENMADVLVDSYAMSTREAKQYLSSIQDLLVPMGMASDAAIIMSNEVVKLSADLASFNNVPTATAMADIQSALVGNFETMKKYGVVLNETVIKQEALNQELWDGKGMVNANVKAFIAFNLMLKGSAAAIGDQQRTMGSYANQMKQLKANIEDVSAVIGNELLPQVTEYIKQMNIAIKQNPKMIEDIALLAKTLLDFAAMLGNATLKVIEWHSNVAKSLFAIKLATAGVITWEGALLHGIEIIDAINESQKGLMHTIDKSTEGFDKYAKAVENANKSKDLIKPPPSVGGGKIGKKAKELDISGLFDSILKDEFTRDQEAWEKFISNAEEAEEKRLEIVKSFNEQYAELGMTKFDIERSQVERMTEIYREAGVEENRIAQLTADKNKQIAEAEHQAKLSIYQDMAGGIAETFQMIAQAGGKQSLAAFRTYQAFSAIEAAIAGEKAVSLALGDTTIPSTIGRFTMAGITGAKAALQVGLILSAQPPSFDVGGVSNARGVYQTGNIREAHVPIPSGKIPVEINGGQDQKAPEVNIFQTIDPSVMDAWAASSRGRNGIFNAISSKPKRLQAIAQGGR